MKKEYTDELVKVIEDVYGAGFLSQGGAESTAAMVDQLDLKNKTLLDLGCGVGGPAIQLAKSEPTLRVVAADVDNDLIAQAKNLVRQSHVSHQVECLTIQPESALPFPDNSFDVVLGKESWLHVYDKLNFFKECYRILKPGATLVSLDWMHASPHYSDRMKKFVLVDGLTFHLTTIDEYLKLLEQAGFKIARVEEKSADNLHYSEQDVEFLSGQLKSNMIAELGGETHEAYLDSWRLQVEIFKFKEMQTFLVYAAKP